MYVCVYVCVLGTLIRNASCCSCYPAWSIRKTRCHRPLLVAVCWFLLPPKKKNTHTLTHIATYIKRTTTTTKKRIKFSHITLPRGHKVAHIYKLVLSLDFHLGAALCHLLWPVECIGVRLRDQDMAHLFALHPFQIPYRSVSCFAFICCSPFSPFAFRTFLLPKIEGGLYCRLDFWHKHNLCIYNIHDGTKKKT